MSALTPDERTKIVRALREDAQMVPANAPGREEAKHLRELADKLEAEPECTCGDKRTDDMHVLGCPVLADPIAVARLSRERDEAREALRDLLDALDKVRLAGVIADMETAYRAQTGGRMVLEGVERTHALVDLSDLAHAVSVIRQLAELSGRAGDDFVASLHRAFADRIEIRAGDDGSPDPEPERTWSPVPNAACKRAADFAVFSKVNTPDEAIEAIDEIEALRCAFLAASRGERVAWPA